MQKELDAIHQNEISYHSDIQMKLIIIHDLELVTIEWRGMVTMLWSSYMMKSITLYILSLSSILTHQFGNEMRVHHTNQKMINNALQHCSCLLISLGTIHKLPNICNHHHLYSHTVELIFWTFEIYRLHFNNYWNNFIIIRFHIYELHICIICTLTHQAAT